MELYDLAPKNNLGIVQVIFKRRLTNLFTNQAAMARRVNKYNQLLKDKIGSQKVTSIPVAALFFVPEHGGFNTESLKVSTTAYTGTLTSRDYFTNTIQPEQKLYAKKYGVDDIDVWLRKYKENYKKSAQLKW